MLHSCCHHIVHINRATADIMSLLNILRNYTDVMLLIGARINYVFTEKMSKLNFWFYHFRKGQLIFFHSEMG